MISTINRVNRIYDILLFIFNLVHINLPRPILKMTCETEYASISNPIKATATVEPNPYVNNNKTKETIIIPKKAIKPIPKLKRHLLEIMSLTLSWNLGAIQNNIIITANANIRVKIELYIIDITILLEF